ncbi:MAG: hypothetical protein EP346_07540 [Bacteroidetes bacterium]|nr:MAG: hypothetical protein EP346_07540 [Bacteroidota bacterium]
MKKSLLFSLVGMLFLSISSYAQDVLHMRNGDVLDVYITEIGVEEISYKETETSRVQISVAKSEVAMIIMENGRRYEFEVDQRIVSAPDYNLQRHRALKVGFFTPLYGSFRVEYEHNLKPGQSLLATTNIIGLGKDLYEENPGGIGFSVGYKFMTSPEYYLERQKRSHRMMGSYFMIEGAFSAYGHDVEYYNNNTYAYESGRGSSVGAALILSYGKQYVMGNSFVLDYSFGMGYGSTSTTLPSAAKGNIDYYEVMPSSYNFIGGFEEFPLVFKTRLSIGLLL